MLFNAFCVFVVQKEKKRERREEKGGVSKSFRNEEFQLTQLRWGRGGGEGEESFLSKAERGGRGRGRGLMRPLHKLPSVDVISRPVICDPRPNETVRAFHPPPFSSSPSPPPPIFSWPHLPHPSSDRKSYEIYPPDRDPCAWPALHS